MADRRMGRLGSRLALAFVVVAVLAVALLAALTLIAAGTQVSGLAASQQRDTVNSVAVALGLAYRGGGGWEHADLRPAYTVAASAGARLQVLDQRGQVVVPEGFDPSQMMAGMMGAMHAGGGVPGPAGEPVQAAVTVGGARVGTAVLRFPGGGLPAAEQRVRTGLEQAVALGAGLAAVLALVVSWLIARRITGPLVSLTRTVALIESGQRGARAGLASAPGEIGELAVAFDRMADALGREDSLRQQLLADVAHELRTPITILQAYCEQMADGTEPATPARLASLRDEVLRLGRLVADLETLAAARAAGLAMVKAPVDLAGVAAGVADLLGPAFESAGVELVPRLEPVVVEGDATRLSQVVTNLLTNALKFSPSGGQVMLATGASGGLARLEVADGGPGIPEQELPHIFDRFWRGSAGRRAAGSGIGLAVVAELVRAHAGQVQVAAEPGHGTRFTVLLPRC
ncbi:MAG TPA: HAMP domain-containing sensor histidine kinase [Streptosporangiaceae bacterium]|nr:HAMP domain-containing sensor histidine kinase [Streptosporangiaceae bacterium]